MKSGMLYMSLKRVKGRCVSNAGLSLLFLLSLVMSAQLEKDQNVKASINISQASDIEDSISFYNNLIVKETKASEYYQRLIAREREQMISDILNMRNMFPLSKYNGKILLRLAELYFEKETEEYENALDQYEDSPIDSMEKEIPELVYTKTTGVYKEIISNEAYQRVHDIALYYNSVCLLRTGQEDESVEELQLLTDNFPKSPYYVISQIKIGDYYFNRPYLKNGQGYIMAAEMYKKAIRDPLHPNYQEAMYKLGWCYYQQDRYTEAVSVFKSLMQTTNLNFSESSGTGLIRNPLLRDEAIEFLAVALDESGSIEDSYTFLSGIDNADYRSKVLFKLADIYALRSNYKTANKVLKHILDNMPMSVMAPRASLAMVNNMRNLGEISAADSSMMHFFDLFGRGSEWHRNNMDSEMRAFVDSQSVKILISSAEFILREANRTGSRDAYIKAAKHYNRLLEQYPRWKETYEVAWNQAVLFDKYIKYPSAAYNAYMKVALDFPYTERRKDALLNALNVVQNVWESGEAVAQEDTSLSDLTLDTNLTEIEQDIVFAVHNFIKFYEHEKEAPDVMMIEASMYFNRKMFLKSIPVYQRILNRKPRAKNYQEVMKLMAMAYMGNEDYKQAEKMYTNLAEEAVEPNYIALGKEGMVEAAYRGAEKLEKNEKYEEASEAFIDVSKRYPMSTLADIAWFSAAEALEKAGKYAKAAETYIDFSRNMALSKYADGALFNGGGDYERIKEYTKAIAAYEELIERFPNSPHLKNALFNISFNYEKLDNFEKVAETNERFAALFPEEQDAPDMLFNTGLFYYKAEKYAKAFMVFKRFYTKYLGTEKELEARLFAGKSQFAINEDQRARDEFESVISRAPTVKNFGVSNAMFYASEAQVELAGIIGREFRKVKLVLPKRELDQAKAKKSDLLKKAVRAYQEVFSYKNEVALLATYRIGELYEDFAVSWKMQERLPDTEPGKVAIVEKRILLNATKSLDRGISFYQKNMEIVKSSGEAHLSPKIQAIIDSTQKKLQFLDILLAKWQLESGNVILNSAIPEALSAKPLTLYLYKNKIMETTLPDFKKAVAVFRRAWKSAKAAGDHELASEAGVHYARENYLLGARYTMLAEEMLNFSYDKNLNEDEREELQFQLEDMAFEIQDNALSQLEEARARASDDHLQDQWTRQIKELLMRLDPQQYQPAKGIRKHAIVSGPLWWVAETVVPGWTGVLADSVVHQSFRSAVPAMFSSPVVLAGKTPDPMWSELSADSVYLRRTISIRGKLKLAYVDITAEDDFILFINGDTVARDENGPGDFTHITSVNVAQLLKQGENQLALLAKSGSKHKAVLFRLSLEEDTTNVAVASGETFSKQPELKEEPKVEIQKRPIEELEQMYVEREKYNQDMLAYQKRTQRLTRKLRSEQNKVIYVKDQIEEYKRKIQALDQQMKRFQKQVDEMTR
ncbi:MAG: tetratricopeptide repeat protein [Fibrobacteria bacterium]|nr:tetratricopeptide repeat protein [Fibrobacteria bacterium]